MLDAYHETIAAHAFMLGMASLMAAEMVTDYDAGDRIGPYRNGTYLMRSKAPTSFRVQILVGKAFAVALSLGSLAKCLALSDLVPNFFW